MSYYSVAYYNIIQYNVIACIILLNIICVLQYVAHMLTQFAIIMLPHVAHMFPCKLIRGNWGTSATAPFVLTPSRSCQYKVGVQCMTNVEN